MNNALKHATLSTDGSCLKVDDNKMSGQVGHNYNVVIFKFECNREKDISNQQKFYFIFFFIFSFCIRFIVNLS